MDERGSGKGRRPVAAGVDASGPARQAALWAAALALHRNVALEILHVASAETLPRWLTALRDAAPLRALLDHSVGARLVVVGHRGRTTARGLLGSTARGLIRSAPCPVIVLGPGSTIGGASAHGGDETSAPARGPAGFVASSP
jgi:nucleotide-binding universal stress UspA family protein